MLDGSPGVALTPLAAWTPVERAWDRWYFCHASRRHEAILANATESALDVDVTLVSADGATLGTKRYALLPLGMTQVTKVVRDLGVSANVSGARLVLATSTAGGAFAAYASTIDNVTSDPRTLLPR